MSEKWGDNRWALVQESVFAPLDAISGASLLKAIFPEASDRIDAVLCSIQTRHLESCVSGNVVTSSGTGGIYWPGGG